MKRLCAAAGLPILMLTTALAAAYDLTQHEWRQRLLFLVAPSEVDPAIAEKREVLAARSEALLDRDLLVFQLFPGRGLAGDRKLDREDVRSLRESLQVGSEDRLMILIGKDGGVKRREPLGTDLRDVFLQIDAMPMRRSEIQAKEGAGMPVTQP